MKTLIAVVTTILLLSVASLPQTSTVVVRPRLETVSKGYIYRNENPTPDQYLVVLSNEVEESELEATAGELAETYGGVLLNVPYLEGVNGFSIQMKEEDALALSLAPGVGYVQEIPEAGFTVETPETAEVAEVAEPSTASGEELYTRVGPAEEEAAPPEEEELTTITVDRERESALVSPLPVNPSEPLGKPADPKTLYFRYGSQTGGFKTIALFGMSGSFLPHVRRLRDWDLNKWKYNPIKENCTLDDVGTGAALKPKYQHCVDALVGAGLNHLQIWVSLNHSVGMQPRERRKNFPNEKVPYPNEQPFKWAGGKWDINTGTEGNNLDATFFSNLRGVVSHCQSRGIIVAVVLFDPWSGWNDDPLEGPVSQPIYSAYYAANNKVSGQNSPYPNGVGFTDPHFSAMASRANPNPANDFIDDDGPNRFMRNVQIAVMQRTAQALSGLNNFYWVLANEPDMGGDAYGRRLIAWHKYMARILRKYETDKYGKFHLIGANLSTNHPDGGTADDDVLDVLKTDTRIDIVSGHYVVLRGRKGPVQATSRFSAIKLLENYNIYGTGGAPDVFNTKRWGFTEGKATGTAGDYPDPSIPNDPPPMTADAARVEAWEFFMNGGALFDHLSYRWANPDGGNETTPPIVLGYYKLLSQFLNPISLDGMKRMTLNQTNRWIEPTVNGIAPHWAAMSNGTHFLLYMHRSTYRGFNFDRYKVYTGAAQPGNSFTVRKLGCGDFYAEWFYPDGQAIGVNGGIQGGALKAFGGFPFTMPKDATTLVINTPSYKQDIVLRITKTQARACLP